MRNRGGYRRAMVLGLLGAAIGCAPIRPEPRSRLLAPAQMSPDSVALDVFFIRAPFGDPVVNLELWQEVDEQQIPVETRRRLAESGFRAGVVGGQMPVCLSRMLQLKGKPVRSHEAMSTNLADVGDEQSPMWSHKQIRAGRRSEIVTSEIYDDLPVLQRDASGLGGRSYPKAQGVIAVRALPEKDGRVRLELVPELHHGELQRNFTGSGNAWRIGMARPRCAFEEMAISATLTPGHTIVLASLPSRPGSLGHHFLTTTSSGRLEQKVLVIRIAQTQHDELFAPTAIPLDALP